MKGLSVVLTKSSIHGLPQLTSKDESIYGHLAWLFFVLVSFSLAGLVIWSNVDNWRSQPAVVTSVEFALVEDEPWWPQLVVCPTTLNAGAMLTGLIQSTHHEVLNSQVMQKFNIILGSLMIMEKYYLSDRWMTMHKIKTLELAPFENCLSKKFRSHNVTDGCTFIQILSVLIDKYSFREAQKIVVTYTAEHIRKLDMGHLKMYLSVNHNLTISDNHEFDPDSLTYEEGVLSLYMTFFDVFDKENKTLLQPQPLSSYMRTDVQYINLKPGKNFGYYLVWILRGFTERKAGALPIYNPILDLHEMVGSIWFSVLKAYLKLGTQHEVLLLMNTYWHGGLRTSLFKPNNSSLKHGYNCMNSNVDNKGDFIHYCKRPHGIAPTCNEYCKLISNISRSTQSRVHNVFEMGLDSPIVPIGAFQTCQHPTNGIFSSKQCWKRVITDKGVCYTSKGDGSLGNNVPSVSSPIRFILDGGIHFIMAESSKIPGQYELTSNLGPDSPGGRGVHWFVAPYRQSAVYNVFMKKVKHPPIKMSLDPGPRFYPVQDQSRQIWIKVDHVLNSTAAFKAMDPIQKNCYLHKYEKSLRNFDEYTEADCMLECAWELAKEHCQCVPWYLNYMYPSNSMCEISGNRCFTKAIESRYNKKSLAKTKCQSRCLMDCDRIQYETRSEWFTDQPDVGFLNNYDNLRVKAIPPKVLAMAGNRTASFLKSGNMAILELYLSNAKLAQKVVRTATMTTTDLISNVGGTLGLFCGMSVLSLVEILYFGIKALWSIVSKKERSGES